MQFSSSEELLSPREANNIDAILGSFFPLNIPGPPRKIFSVIGPDSPTRQLLIRQLSPLSPHRK